MADHTNEELRLRLIQTIRQYAGDVDRFDRADMDEISMLTEACAMVLPKKFAKIVSDFDNNFSDYGSKKLEFLMRSLRVLEVAEILPNREDLAGNSELLPVFVLTKKDKDRVLKLCSDMRKIVFSSPDFDEPHKKRLLNRIAAIEKNVLSPKGLFDVVLGGVSDVGETLGKFGKDIKPLSDRMAEIAKITRRGSKEYEQIPAPEEIKKLPPPEDEPNGE